MGGSSGGTVPRPALSWTPALATKRGYGENCGPVSHNRLKRAHRYPPALLLIPCGGSCPPWGHCAPS